MQTQLSEYQNRVNQALQQHLQCFAAKQKNTATPLFSAIEYATLNQGKRLRPALIYAVAEAFNIPLKNVDSAACAIELIHSYSLVHDDLPAMDNDDLRRGLPTCHIKYDEATAILVGDAQQTLAFQILSEDRLVKPTDLLEIISLLSQASGPLGMIGGQFHDIQSEGKIIPLSELKTLHTLKTGALIQCSLLIGAVQHPGYRTIQPGLLKLGEMIGLAFQVQDDILDIESDTETLGKPQGSDVQLDKSTYPKLLGIEKAKQYRDELISQALKEIESLNIHSEFLVSIINYIAERKH